MLNNPILHVDSITKQFDSIRAVSSLSFSLREGEIFALLGPNGAGKTTTVRMILGIILPDSGTIRFTLGGSHSGRPLPGELGYLPEDRGLYKDIPIRKSLLYMAALRGMIGNTASAAVNQWLERMDLKERGNDKLETLSRGNQQKVQFISAIVHQPSLAILDEPFAGLDPINQEFVLDCLRSLADEGMTILLCAHQMNLVERIADRVLLMNRGRQLLSGTLSEIRQATASTSKIFITADSPAIGGGDAASLQHHPSVERIELVNGSEFCVVLRRTSAEGGLNDFLAAAITCLRITSFRSEPITLHDIFVDAVQKDERRIDSESEQ
jgi:ABC-2 type transport system ATP-binding protein